MDLEGVINSVDEAQLGFQRFVIIIFRVIDFSFSTGATKSTLFPQLRTPGPGAHRVVVVMRTFYIGFIELDDQTEVSRCAGVETRSSGSDTVPLLICRGTADIKIFCTVGDTV